MHLCVYFAYLYNISFPIVFREMSELCLHLNVRISSLMCAYIQYVTLSITPQLRDGVIPVQNLLILPE